MFSGSKRSQQFSKQIQIYVAGSVFDGMVLVELVIMLDQVRYHGDKDIGHHLDCLEFILLGAD